MDKVKYYASPYRYPGNYWQGKPYYVVPERNRLEVFSASHSKRYALSVAQRLASQRGETFLVVRSADDSICGQAFGDIKT